MATVVNLKNNNNVTRKGVVGFSWTTLFFGPFVPLLRGDWKWFIIMLLANIFTLWIASFILCFVYNKIYTRDLLEKGYSPEDSYSQQLLVKYGLITEGISMGEVQGAIVSESKFDWQKLLAPSVLILLTAFFLIATPHARSMISLVNVLSASYFIGFMALGVTFVIITGGIDLSLGTTMMCGMLMGGLALRWGWSIWAALAFSVAVSTFIGLINGILVAYLKLPPFIATLGTQMMGMGFGAIATRVTTMRFTDQSFKQVFYRFPNNLPDNLSFFRGFPIGIAWLLAAFAIAWIILNRTRFGRYVFAMGSNYEAARLSGINTRFWQMLVYTLCGFFCGVAGIFFGAVYTTIIPSTGNGLELLAIAGVVIGGTSMSGGTGSLTGTLIGVFTMSVLRQGLMLMGLQGHWQTFMTGLVVVGAVLLDQYRIKRASAVKKI